MAKTPGLNLPFGIDPVNAVPVDANYGPYASLAAARSAIPLALRYDGLTVQITGLGNYYWTAADLTDTGLVAKGLQAEDLLAARRRHTEPDSPETDWCELPGFVNRTSPPTLFLNGVLQEYGKIYSGYPVNT